MKIIKSLEDSCLLIEVATKKLKMNQKVLPKQVREQLEWTEFLMPHIPLKTTKIFSE